jgi:predicted AlkP superfamily pyrophosphatase or phosphodiesterase
MHPLVVLNVVGLALRFVGEHTPNLKRLAGQGAIRPLATVLPAVTCTAQTSLLTGGMPRDHGIVANGWYFRDLAEIMFWRQSNHLVSGDYVWDAARRRDASFTAANMFWWYNMYSSADIGVTPRPMYPADGRKIPDCYAAPSKLRDELTERFGRFPLFSFWGPATDISSSRWIADATLYVRATRQPTLTVCYLPHLDYNLQRLGPDHPAIAADLAAIDAICGELIDDAERSRARVIVVSEYGIVPVSRPVHINRALRQAGLIQVRTEMGRELLDAGASDAFAVADHQVAHVYVRSGERVAEVKALLEGLVGIESVLDDEGKRQVGLDHPRSGELVAVAAADSWFTYYYWLDDARAPDFARTVEIHRKPGFDPVELFIDPAFTWPKGAVGWRLARRKLGFRALLDVIPLDASLVKGSHGRVTDRPEDGPLIIGSQAHLLPDGPVSATAFKQVLLDYLFGERP